MTHEEELLITVKALKGNLLIMSLPITKYATWEDEIKSGVIIDSNLRTWLNNQLAYECEKHKPFAEYLRGLLG